QLALPDVLAPHGPHARRVQLEPFEQQQREEQERLVLRHPAEESALAGALRATERERGDVDVRILVLVVRVGVMAVVRADPPAVAQSGESTMGESGCIVGLAATE